MAAAADLSEQLNKILQCSICIDVFTDPRALPCQHSFCFKCIADWCKDKQRRCKVSCPECREEFVIPDSGVDGIKKNFFIANMLSIKEVEQKTVKSGVSSESKYKPMLPVTPRVTDNPQLLLTLNQPPTDKGRPRQVYGVAMLDKYLCVVYWNYNKVQVFSCEGRLQKIKDTQVNEMSWPSDMVGCSVTSQLFISGCDNGNIFRVNVNTGVSDVFIKLGCSNATLSLVENRLLVTSRDSLLMYDIHSGRRMKNIPYTEDMKKNGVLHAIEFNRDSFFVSQQQSNDGPSTVSEINSEGRVIRVFRNKEQLYCGHLAMDSVGRLLVTGRDNGVILLDEHLQFIKFLRDRKRLDDAWPVRLSYNKNNNRLAAGVDNGHVKIFDLHV